MPKSQSTFIKRQKELTRQQKQRDKAERKNQRRQEKSAGVSGHEMAELHEHAGAQAELFNIGVGKTETAGSPHPVAGSVSDS
jgi:hypothetical protein